MGNSSSGHVCHSPQHASSPVYVSSSGTSSTDDRCPLTGLAGKVDVHVSTIFPAQQSHSEAQDHSGGRGDTHSPLVAVTAVVSTSTTSVCGPPMLLSIPPRPAVTGFSKEVSKFAAPPSRPSTNRMYHDSWLRFINWATGKGFDPLGPTAAQIAAFLYELFSTHGLLPHTIKGYRSCLASVLSHTGKLAAVQAISEMIMSIELQRPRFTPVLPPWDLGIVLEALSKPPYGPLREASLKHLTLKSVFLLAVDSAGRRNKLQTLGFAELIRNIYSSNLKGLSLLYISPQSSCEKIRGQTKSMIRGTSQRFQLVNQSLVLLIAQ